jgi:hypothetical protein
MALKNQSVVANAVLGDITPHADEEPKKKAERRRKHK